MKKFGCITVDEFGNTFYTDEAAEFGEQIFKTIRGVADKFIENNDCDYMINTEQIPGENALGKLCTTKRCYDRCLKTFDS
jgi:anaerobic ribonucleoside-triphosphate reductase